MTDFTTVIDSLQGGITAIEAEHLRRLVRELDAGCVVEVGSYRGKSAVALATGARENESHRPHIHCVEPHVPFTGLYGGTFGPDDRRVFYEVMLASGAWESVSLLNVSSEVASSGWTKPVGLLFLDGDHTYAGVSSDLDCWERHVMVGGHVVLDDAADPAGGPFQLIDELVATRRYRVVDKVGKMCTLRKCRAELDVDASSLVGRQRMLVLCERVVANGGLLRFDRAGAELWRRGHDVAFLSLTGEAEVETEIPVIDESTARSLTWDVTMVPGAGFAPTTIRRFQEFREDRFGTRVQHVLNDRSRRQAFHAVNASFCPDVVIFNNMDWSPGTYTEFQARRFHHLIGGVDARELALVDRVSASERGSEQVVGGLAPKHGELLVAAVAQLPDHRLRLFGVPTPAVEAAVETAGVADRVELLGALRREELASFYESVDVVVALDQHAGWSNVAIEAMAAGRPLVCTTPGTDAFAVDGRNALVLPELSVSAVAQGLRRLLADPEAARQRARQGRIDAAQYDWSDYAHRLLTLSTTVGHEHYMHVPELGLHGKWPASQRFDDLEAVLGQCDRADVLDLGAADGVIAREFLARGARSVHGFELMPARVMFARGICADHAGAEFRVGDLSDWASFEQRHEDLLRPSYDVVLYLGIHHHLPKHTRLATLRGAAERAGRLLAYRSPVDVTEGDGVIDHLEELGLRRIGGTGRGGERGLGGVLLFERVDARSPVPVPSGPVPLPPTRKPPVLDRQFISFPKSGRSWLRYALTQLDVAGQITFQHDGFEYNDGSKPPLDFSIDARVQRYQHSRVVYLERDPRDVIVSLYHQITGRFCDFFGYEGTISDFIRDEYFGAANLAGFRRAWRGASATIGALRVTYEECHEDMAAVLTRILEHYELPVDVEAVQAAACAASFENMKRVERDGSFAQPWLRLRNASPKVRVGRVGTHLDELSPDDLAYLDDVFGCRG